MKIPASVLIITFLIPFFTEPLKAMNFRVTGTPEAEYKMECTNSINQRFQFKGKVPGTHSVLPRRPIDRCYIEKSDPKTVIRMSVTGDFRDGADQYEQAEPSKQFEIPRNKKGATVHYQWYEERGKGNVREYNK